MLMNSPSSPSRDRRIAENLGTALARLWSGAMHLYLAAKLRRDIGALCALDDYLLTDIGLTRDDVRHAAAQPFWRDATVILQQHAGRARGLSLRNGCASAEEHNRRALAALGDRDVANLSDLGRRMRRDARRQLAAACLLMAGFLTCLGATAATARPVCKPRLTITNAQLSPMRPPTLERQWTAVVSVDASRCAENAGGPFEIGFSRLKENALEVDFYERFQWKAPSVKVDVDFWADEAVERYWLGNVAPCACR